MEYRLLGRSGLKVPVLCYGVATFGTKESMLRGWGSTDTKEAKRLVDICIEAGVRFFDTANVYSTGDSETVLGETLKGRRHEVLISTKATFKMGEGPNQVGSSRYHLLEECNASLKRLGTDYIDIYHMHGFDSCRGDSAHAGHSGHQRQSALHCVL
jgi:aryl-alcohol dehydrogenase-like predicted oxidoreductase